MTEHVAWNHAPTPTERHTAVLLLTSTGDSYAVSTTEAIAMLTWLINQGLWIATIKNGKQSRVPETINFWMFRHFQAQRQTWWGKRGWLMGLDMSQEVEHRYTEQLIVTQLRPSPDFYPLHFSQIQSGSSYLISSDHDLCHALCPGVPASNHLWKCHKVAAWSMTQLVTASRDCKTRVHLQWLIDLNAWLW